MARASLARGAIKRYPFRLLRRFLRNRVADPTGYTERDWLDDHWQSRNASELEDLRFWNSWASNYEDANPKLATKHFEIRQFLRSIRHQAGNGLFDSLPSLRTRPQPEPAGEVLPIEVRLR